LKTKFWSNNYKKQDTKSLFLKYTNVYIHTHIYIHIYTHKHTHTHTHTLTHVQDIN